MLTYIAYHLIMNNENSDVQCKSQKTVNIVSDLDNVSLAVHCIK